MQTGGKVNNPIDFVITWVNGQDPAWRKERTRYSPSGGEDNSECRYRDWGLLRYWFRGVEKFAPWVRKIHFITWGHLPKWLDISHPKLHLVRHEDYIPSKFLPTFNSCVLEIYMHRIEGLAEHFVYFNDDMFPLLPLKPELFFVSGKPCDMLAFQPVVANPQNPVMSHGYLNTALILCKYFNKRENVKNRPWNYFYPGYPPLYFFYNILELFFPLYTGFYTIHGPSPFCRKTFLEIWEKEEVYLTAMSHNRFRSRNDVSQYMFREWQKLSGNFHPRNVQRYFSYYNIEEHNIRLNRAIRNQKSRIICINDDLKAGNLEQIRREIQSAFRAILPERSSYEC